MNQLAGIEDIYIGETLADPENPVALPVITVDEPALSMTIGINTSPLAGREGKKLTARLVKNRLDAELVGNVSIRVLPTERPDASTAATISGPSESASTSAAAVMAAARAVA